MGTVSLHRFQQLPNENNEFIHFMSNSLKIKFYVKD